jgi:hypothetical protein
MWRLSWINESQGQCRSSRAEKTRNFRILRRILVFCGLKTLALAPDMIDKRVTHGQSLKITETFRSFRGYAIDDGKKQKKFWRNFET